MQMCRLLLPLFLFLTIFSTLAQSAGQKIALVPPLLDGGVGEQQHLLAREFQDALLAELYANSEAILVSRSQLSSIAFENKLIRTKQADVRSFEVLACDHILICVFDYQNKRMSIYPAEVSEKMTIGKEITVQLRSRKDVVRSAKAASSKIARALKLNKASQHKSDDRVEKNTEYAIAVAPSHFSMLSAQSSEEAAFFTETLSMQAQEIADAHSQINLLDRQHLADLMQEQEINSLQRTASSRLTKIQSLDLLLTPSVLMNGKTKVYQITAICPQSSSVIDVIQVNPKKLTNKMLKKFVGNCLIKRKNHRSHHDTLSKAKRQQEADFYINQLTNLTGLRMPKQATQIFKLELAQAAVALSMEDDVRLSKTLYNAIRNTTYYGSSDNAYSQTYREYFHLPIKQLSDNFTYMTVSSRCNYWRQQGDYQKALLALTTPDAQEIRSHLYEAEAHCLYNLERYQDCADHVLARKKFSSYAMRLVVDSYRELGQHDKEQQLMYRNRHVIGASLSRQLRLMRLTREQVSPKEAIAFWHSYAHQWTRIKPEVLLELALCYSELGDNKAAADIYKSIVLRAETTQSNWNESMSAVNTAKSALKTLKIDNSKFTAITPASITDFYTEMNVEILTDKTIPLTEVKKVAQCLANYWGIKYHIYYGVLNFEKSPSYDRIKKSVQSQEMIAQLNHFPAFKTPTAISRIYLTNLRLISRINNSNADVFSAHGYTYSLASTHYIHKYKKWEKRSTLDVTAIMLSPIDVVKRTLKVQEQAIKLPIPPYTFSNNPNLHFHEHRLSLSESTAQQLKGLASGAIYKESARRTTLGQDSKITRGLAANENNFVNNASNSLQKTPAIIITPK